MSAPRPPAHPRLGAAAPGVADAVLRDGKVYCGRQDGGDPAFAEALALRDGRILRVGSNAQAEELAGPGTEVLDLDGRTVVPGLVDSHVHVVRGGLTWTDEVPWFEVPTLEEALRRLDADAARRPAGEWLRVVGGWHPGQFAERRGPTSAELSERFPDHPVYVQLLYEEAVLNARGLEAAGLTAAAADPPRGTVERDPSTGSPTGLVRGMGAFQHCLAQGARPSFEDQVRGTAALLRTLNGWGLTGAVDPGGFGMTPESYEPLFALARAGEVTLRTRLYVCPATPGQELDELLGWLRHVRPGLGDEWVRHVGIGELTVFGCHDLEGLTPFEMSADAQAELARVATEAARRGWPVHMHSILDDTTSAILDVWEAVAREHPLQPLRWSLAHAEPVSARNLDRLAALGCGIAVQDRLVYRATDSARAWSEATVRTAPPLRDVLARDIPLGAGTDATRVASPNPWVSLWWLVTGRTVDEGPERDAAQCLSRTEALDAYTAGSAWFSFDEAARGRLATGMLADLAVLSDDYFTVAEEDIKTLDAVLTLVDGRVAAASGPFAGLDRDGPRA